MTREEAIKVINNHLEHWKRLLKEKICDETDGTETISAFRMAIKALEQEPCDVPEINVGDMISRQAGEDAIAEAIVNGESLGYAVAYDILFDLPPATPQPKMGRWLKIKPYPLQLNDYECSECSHGTDDNTEAYCSECGAKMEVNDEDSD